MTVAEAKVKVLEDIDQLRLMDRLEFSIAPKETPAVIAMASELLIDSIDKLIAIAKLDGAHEENARMLALAAAAPTLSEEKS